MQDRIPSDPRMLFFHRCLGYLDLGGTYLAHQRYLCTYPLCRKSKEQELCFRVPGNDLNGSKQDPRYDIETTRFLIMFFDRYTYRKGPLRGPFFVREQKPLLDRH